MNKEEKIEETIGILNYGIAGNVFSIEKAINAAGGKVLIINNALDFNKVDKLILPGVGSFSDAIKELKSNNMLNALISAIKIKKTLGICLGMQILSTIGFENGENEGLKLIDAEVRRMPVNATIPHMGFNTITVIGKNDLLSNLKGEEFYFMHSFEVINYKNIAALTDYENHTFVSAIQKGNLYGVQFHPEKSREAGIKLFRNFINL